MREKAAKKSARSIKYLLSADRRLHKLSLKKISGPVNKAKQARSNRSNPSVRTTRSSALALYGERAIVLGVIAVVAGVVMVAARSSTSSTPMAAAPVTASAAAFPVAKKTTAVTTGVTSAWAKASEAPPAATTAAPAVAIPAEATRDVASVTVTGCLELDQKTFRLKDASGVDAPAGRTWKTGFFKKRRSSIELVDETNALKLRNHLGQRVAATGTLTNRELHARSLERVAASCN